MGHKMAGVAGFEPTNGGIKTRCLTTWLYPKELVSPEGFEPPTHGLEGRCSIQLSYEPTFAEWMVGAAFKKMERMMRIELTPSAWKAEVLPLNYIRKKVGAEDEIRTRDPRLGKAMLYP